MTNTFAVLAFVGRQQFERVSFAIPPSLGRGSLYDTRLYLRPTERKDIFSVSVFGKDVDFDPLFASHEALFKHIKTVSNREELTFGDVKWITEFRSATFVDICTIKLTNVWLCIGPISAWRTNLAKAACISLAMLLTFTRLPAGRASIVGHKIQCVPSFGHLPLSS